MRTVSVPVAVADSDFRSQLRIQTLQWPARCACCGEPNQGSTVELHHGVHAGSGNILDHYKPGGVIRVYPLSWRLPYCRECTGHQVEVAFIPPGLLFLLAFMLWLLAVVGYQFLVGDPAHNILAILAWVGLGLVLGYASFKLPDWIEGWAKRRIRSRMKPTCTAQMLPVSIQSDLRHINFTFQNDTFADEFRALNRL